MSNSPLTDLVEQASPLSFAMTLERLEQTIAKAGMTIFARIDHAENARAVGLTMQPATVLIYGKAEGGTPIMLASPHAALALPLHVLVREDQDGQTLVSFCPIAPQLQALGVELAMAARLQPAQTLLLTALKD